MCHWLSCMSDISYSPRFSLGNYSSSWFNTISSLLHRLMLLMGSNLLVSVMIHGIKCQRLMYSIKKLYSIQVITLHHRISNDQVLLTHVWNQLNCSLFSRFKWYGALKPHLRVYNWVAIFYLKYLNVNHNVSIKISLLTFSRWMHDLRNIFFWLVRYLTLRLFVSWLEGSPWRALDPWKIIPPKLQMI